MARGNQIIVSAEPGGKFNEGYIGAGITPKPGTVLQEDKSVALKGGRPTYKLFDGAADGSLPLGPIWILLENWLLGKDVDTAYAAGERCQVYCPKAGDELNMLFLDIAGTTDDHPAGEVAVIDDTTGKLVVSAGTEATAPFRLNETITDPAVDTLAWVTYSGY